MDAIESEKKSPFHGLWVILLVSILGPLILYLLFRVCFHNFAGKYRGMESCLALALATLISTLFHISCMIAGAWNEPFGIVKARIKAFNQYFKIIKLKAFRYYFDDLKTEGGVFWIMLALFNTTLSICIINFIRFFKRMY